MKETDVRFNVLR